MPSKSGVWITPLDCSRSRQVIGSGKPFLSCMLTLKTNGSEAAERGPPLNPKP
jgi:hypothetical protein